MTSTHTAPAVEMPDPLPGLTDVELKTHLMRFLDDLSRTRDLVDVNIAARACIADLLGEPT